MKKVEARIALSVSPQTALNAFTEFDSLQGWWGVERCLVEKQTGGAYALTWGISDKGFQYISCGVVKSYLAADHLEIANLYYFNPERSILGGMSLTVKVAPQKKGTLLSLCQDGYQSGTDWNWYYDAVKTAWPEALQQLKSFVEKKQMLVEASRLRPNIPRPPAEVNK